MENNKPSAATLTVFISLTTVIVALLTLINEGQVTFDEKNIRYLAYILLVSLFLTSIVYLKAINKYVNRQIEKFKLLSSLIFEKRTGHLKFVKPYGEEVIYTERVLLKRIKRKFIYEGGIICSGKINTDIQTFNCYNSLNNKKDDITIIYGRKRIKESESLINKRQLQFGFAIKMEDAFLEEKETWTSRVRFYTKEYNLRMSFNKKNPPKYVSIEQALRNDKGEFLRNADGDIKFEALSTDPLVIANNDKVVVKITLLHLEKGSMFRVLWEWNKKPTETQNPSSS